MVQRRRPAPHQPDRLGEELRQQSEHQRRQAPAAGPFGDGVSVAATILSGAASVIVRHRLGRVPKGFLVTYAEAALSTNLFVTAKTRDTITLAMSLATGADLPFTVWVY